MLERIGQAWNGSRISMLARNGIGLTQRANSIVQEELTRRPRIEKLLCTVIFCRRSRVDFQKGRTEGNSEPTAGSSNEEPPSLFVVVKCFACECVRSCRLQTWRGPPRHACVLRPSNSLETLPDFECPLVSLPEAL